MQPPALREGIAVRGEMIVSVDEAGKQGEAGDIDSTSAFAGRDTVWRGPTALIRPSLMSTAASGTGAAPVPSIRVAPRSSCITSLAF